MGQPGRLGSLRLYLSPSPPQPHADVSVLILCLPLPYVWFRLIQVPGSGCWHNLVPGLGSGLRRGRPNATALCCLRG